MINIKFLIFFVEKTLKKVKYLYFVINSKPTIINSVEKDFYTYYYQSFLNNIGIKEIN